MNNEYVVGDSGTISLPYVQQVQATGRTLGEVQQEIQASLAQQQILKNPVVNVEHVALRPFYILGEVRNPGEYAFRPGTTVISAVAMAGGFTYRASKSKVTITRLVNGRPVTGSADQQALIMPGDRILVSERWF
jgi:protein involved in polysaccharide export with SLBB domain